MKKIVIALLLVVCLSIAFCACNSQTKQNEEGTSASAEVSSDIGSTENSGSTDTTTGKKGKESSTLETIEDAGEEEIVIPFDEIEEDTTKNSGKETTTKKDSNKESTSVESYELPVIPIP